MRVLRHIIGRARTREEALDFWTPQVPGPMWVGHVDERPVGWRSLHEWEEPPPGAELGEVVAEISRQDWASTLS